MWLYPEPFPLTEASLSKERSDKEGLKNCSFGISWTYTLTLVEKLSNNVQGRGYLVMPLLNQFYELYLIPRADEKDFKKATVENS